MTKKHWWLENAPAIEWDWPMGVLFIALIMTVSVRLEMTRWADELGYVESITLAGAIVGWMLAISRFTAPVKRVIFLGYTIGYLPLALANMIQTESEPFLRMASLAGRITNSLQAFWYLQPVSDPLLFVSAMAILLWLTASICMVQLLRHRSIAKAILLPTVIILTIQYYDGLIGSRIWNLAVYFVLCLALVGRLNLGQARQEWVKQGVIAGTQLESDLSRFMVIFSLTLVMAVWLIPYPHEFSVLYLRGISAAKSGSTFIEKRLEDLFAALTPSVELSGTNRFPNAFGVGTQAPMGDEAVFRTFLGNASTPKYFSARIYDRYQSGKWVAQSGEKSTTVVDWNDNVNTQNTIEIAWVGDATGIAVVPLYTVGISREATIQKDGITIDAFPLQWDLAETVLAGEKFKAAYLQPAITQKLLRESSTEYPEALALRLEMDRQALDPKLISLAEEITDGALTPYDQTAKITAYLRSKYVYSETVTAPPRGKDPVEWFLFENKSGFCNQFSSAEVLLLRAKGIPARLVLGFTKGEPAENGQKVFRQKNAHTWVQVYFSGVGWVNFEPTPNVDPIIYPSGETSVVAPPLIPLTGDFADREQNRGIDEEGAQPPDTLSWPSAVVWKWAGIILGVAALIGGGYFYRKQIRKVAIKVPGMIVNQFESRGLEPPGWMVAFFGWLLVPAGSKKFAAINLSLTILTGRVQPSSTPQMRAKYLAELLPERKPEIIAIYEEHARIMFSRTGAVGSSTLAPARVLWAALRAKSRRWLYG